MSVGSSTFISINKIINVEVHLLHFRFSQGFLACSLLIGALVSSLLRSPKQLSIPIEAIVLVPPQGCNRRFLILTSSVLNCGMNLTPLTVIGKSAAKQPLLK